MINCVVIDDDPIQNNLICGFIEVNDNLRLAQSFLSPIKALAFLSTPKDTVDLIILDIEMPQVSGLEFLEIYQGSAKVVIISSQDSYAIDGYQYAVIDYVKKPVSQARFLKLIQKIKTEMDSFACNKEYLFVKSNSLIEKIKLPDVLYIEAAVDYVKIVFKDHEKLVNSTMGQIIERLPKPNFIRVHRSFIVNLEKIDRVDGYVIEVDDHLIKLSKSYKDDLLNKLNLL